MELSDKTKRIYERLDTLEAVRIFDFRMAKQIGVDLCLIFYKILDLCKDNNDNAVEFENRMWTMVSSKTLNQEDNFPWIPTRTIRDHLQKLEDLGLLISRVEEHSANTTKYYSINEEMAHTYLYEPENIKKNDDGKNCQRPGKNCQRLDTDVPINKVVKRLKIKDLNIKDLKDSSKPISRPRDLMFDIVAEITQSDPKLIGPRIAKASNALKKAGYIPEDVSVFLTWWKQNDFRWKQSKQLPLPEQIITYIGRSKSLRQDVRDDNTSLYPADYIPGETLKDYTERRKSNVTD